jgi:hypothetical protein
MLKRGYIYLVVLVFVLVFSLSFVAADGDVCCEITREGEWCVFTDDTNCDPSGLSASTTCEQTSYCQIGTCFNSDDGQCFANTPQATCAAEEGSTWSSTSLDQLNQCIQGCCVIGDQASFVTEVACKSLGSQFEDVSLEFDSSIVSEVVCLNSVKSKDFGCCIQGDSYDFTTREDCSVAEIVDPTDEIVIEGFHEGVLCSNDLFSSGCSKQHTTGCYEGKIYWYDSCGNRENIYTEEKRSSYNEGYVLDEIDSCVRNGPGDNSCGNCDYTKGLSCGDDVDNVMPVGDVACLDLNCEETEYHSASPLSGAPRLNGESWCVYDSRPGEGLDTVGSRHYRHLCINGEEVVESCADFRDEVCVSGVLSEDSFGNLEALNLGDGDYIEAACRENRNDDCNVCNSEIDPETGEFLDPLTQRYGCCTNEDVRDCHWIEDTRETEENLEQGITEGICVPQVPPGLQFWSEDGQVPEDSAVLTSEVCSAATTQCQATWRLTGVSKLLGKADNADKWSLISESPDGCTSERDWIVDQNTLCRSLGDCGAYYNFVNEPSYGGFATTLFEDSEETFFIDLEPPYLEAADLGDTDFLSNVDALNEKKKNFKFWNPNTPTLIEHPAFTIAAVGIGTAGLTGLARCNAEQTAQDLVAASLADQAKLDSSLAAAAAALKKEAAAAKENLCPRQYDGFGCDCKTGETDGFKVKTDAGLCDFARGGNTVCCNKGGTGAETSALSSLDGLGSPISTAGSAMDGIRAAIKDDGSDALVRKDDDTCELFVKGEPVTGKGDDCLTLNDHYEDDILSADKAGDLKDVGDASAINGGTTPTAGSTTEYDFLPVATPASVGTTVVDGVVKDTDGNIIFYLDSTPPRVESLISLPEEDRTWVSAITLIKNDPYFKSDLDLAELKIVGFYTLPPGASSGNHIYRYDDEGNTIWIGFKDGKLLEFVENEAGLVELERILSLSPSRAPSLRAPGVTEATNAIGKVGFGQGAGCLISSAIPGVGLFKKKVDKSLKDQVVQGLSNEDGAYSTQVGSAVGRARSFGSVSRVANFASLIAVGYLAVDYANAETREVNYEVTCGLWQPPEGGENCEECNNEGTPCSEYKCRSLGAACDLVNEGTEEEKCISLHINDVNSPIIDPNEELFSPIYPIIEKTVEDNKGFEVSTSLPSFEPIQFGLSTDEPAQCKYSVNPETEFVDMQSYFGSELYLYEHSLLFSLGPEFTDEDVLSVTEGVHKIYVRCADASGNHNERDYFIEFTVDRTPDLTPAEIVYTSIESGVLTQYGQEDLGFVVYVNEPATCRWSKEDSAYEFMQGEMDCPLSGASQSSEFFGTYECLTTLTGVSEDEINNYYFRCEDTAGNINENSFAFETKKSSDPLEITSTLPAGEIFSSPVVLTDTNVELKIETIGGSSKGVAECRFSESEILYDDMATFLNTDATVHTQPLTLIGGNYVYNVVCQDVSGNRASSEVIFEIKVDISPPIVESIYIDSAFSTLVVTMNEETTCEFANEEFVYGEGTLMTGIETLEHEASVAGLEYSVICVDTFGTESSFVVDLSTWTQ